MVVFQISEIVKILKMVVKIYRAAETRFIRFRFLHFNLDFGFGFDFGFGSLALKICCKLKKKIAKKRKTNLGIEIFG